MQTTLSRVISAGFALTLLAAVGNDAPAHENPVARLSVAMPDGGCRLTIGEDGKASIFYGALPRLVRVTPGTFNFDQLVLLLRAKSYPQSDRTLHSEPVGTVSLPESQELRFINDAALVRSLLERAWKAREAPTRQFDEADYSLIAGACAFSDEETPVLGLQPDNALKPNPLCGSDQSSVSRCTVEPAHPRRVT